MEKNFKKFLASPLKNTVNYFEENNYNYTLTEIKPPFKNKVNLKNKGKKRVLKIKEEKDVFEIIWSFQYNS